MEEAGLSNGGVLRDQLAALNAGSRKRWRAFRKFELVCGGCGDTMVEVMTTQPWVILRHNRNDDDPWMIFLYDGPPDESIPVFCRCQAVEERFSRRSIRFLVIFKKKKYVQRAGERGRGVS
jgi:hypothetical protein